MCKECDEALRSLFASQPVERKGTPDRATNMSTGTIEGETKRLEGFMQDAVVTNMPSMFLGAPYNSGKYGIGYVDGKGVNRVFIISIADAEGLAQGMLQEIAATKNKERRKDLAGDLRGVLSKLEAGMNIDSIREELADLAEGA